MLDSDCERTGYGFHAVIWVPRRHECMKDESRAITNEIEQGGKAVKNRVTLCSSGVEIPLGKNVGVQKFARRYHSENVEIYTPPLRGISTLLGVLGVPRSLLGVRMC